MDMETPWSNRFVEEECNQEWTEEDDHKFQNALAIYDENTHTHDRWEKVAAMIPGKTVFDVINYYKKLEEELCEIEVGPVSSYLDSSFSPEMQVGDHSDDGGSKKRSTTDTGSENKRKKVFHWRKDEHELFLQGLQQCGKGDWKNIARKFVVTKTPTQVASHAQKFYIRQKLSKGRKDDSKRRSSIHDITLDIMENTTPIEDKSLPTFQESQIMPLPPQQMKNTSIQDVRHEWISCDHNNDQLMAFNPSNYEMSMLSSQVMPSVQLENSTIQNLQPEWNNSNDNNGDQLMVFNPSNYEMSMLSSQVMPSPQLENTTGIQNVQPEWINGDHNNDQLMAFNLSNDQMSMMSSQYHGVTGVPDLYDIYYHFGCAQ